MVKKALIALALSGAFASAHAGVLLQENFDSVPGLGGSGWVMTNASTPGGFVKGWFQGDQQVFGAKDGAPQAYAAANYDNAPVGGTIDNWLITPLFSTETATTVSLWLRAAYFPGYFDKVAFGFSSGGTATSSFTLGNVAAFTVPTNDWTLFTVNLAARGAGTTGRFAIQYTGNADDANYVGVDSLTIATNDAAAVPEPASIAVLVAGLFGLAAARRRRQRG